MAPTETQPSPRDITIYEAVCAGRSQVDVGKEHKLSRQRVCQIVQAVETWLVPQMVERVRELKTRHTTSLEHVFREAMGAWEKSKGDRLKFRRGSTANGEIDETTREQSCGDPRFLDAAMKALTDIRKMWGANEPLARDDNVMPRVAGMSPDEAARTFYEHQAAEYQRKAREAGRN